MSERAASPALHPVPTVELTRADLSPGGQIICPHPKSGIEKWNGHPAVALAPGRDGSAHCPYCGTTYHFPG